MAKNLVKRALEGALKGAKRGLLIAGAVGSLGLSGIVTGCKECVIPPNHTPEGSLSVSPIEGYAPLEVRIQYDGEDADGKEDIVGYKVSIDEGKDGIVDEEIYQSSPIDMTRTFNENTSIKGEVIDSCNAKDEDYVDINVEEPPVEPPIPPVEPPVDDDYVDISGRVEDCENDELTPSSTRRIVRVYDNDTMGNKTTIPIKSVTKGTKVSDSYGEGVQTEDDGDFGFTLEKKVDSDDEVYLQAGIQEAGTENLQGFIRTVDEPAVDADISAGLDPRGNPAVRVVPTEDLRLNGITDGEYFNSVTQLYETLSAEEAFKRHMREVNPSYLKWYFENHEEIKKFEKIGIVENNWDDFEEGYFDFDFINEDFISRIIDNNDIGSYVEGKISESQIEPILGNPSLLPGVGWIVVQPDIDPIDTKGEHVAGYTISADTDNDGYIDYACIVLKVNSSGRVDRYTTNHEFGHAFDFPNGDKNPGTLSPDLTVMNYNVTHDTPLFADKKAAKIVNEKTYTPRERLDDILGLNWGF